MCVRVNNLVDITRILDDCMLEYPQFLPHAARLNPIKTRSPKSKSNKKNAKVIIFDLFLPPPLPFSSSVFLIVFVCVFGFFFIGKGSDSKTKEGVFLSSLSLSQSFFLCSIWAIMISFFCVRYYCNQFSDPILQKCNSPCKKSLVASFH